MNRILIFRGGALGDFIVTEPLLSALRRHWPEARLEVVCYPAVGRLALACGLAHAVHSLDAAGFAGMFVAGHVPGGDYSRFLASFDLVVSCLHDPGGVFVQNLASAPGGRIVASEPIVTDGHAVDHFLPVLTQLEIDARHGTVPLLSLLPGMGAAGVRAASKMGDELIAFHPGSGSWTKNWPLANYVRLAEQVERHSLGRPVLLLGEAETGMRETLEAEHSQVEIMAGMDVVDLAGFLSCCRGYAGNDSGVSHLAASLGVPVVALFGPSDPTMWAPRGRNVTIVRSTEPTTEGLQSMSVEMVFAALSKAVQRLPGTRSRDSTAISDGE